MSQIKKKFIASNAIDGSKIQLQTGQALRAKDQNGDNRDLFYFSQSSEFRFSMMPKIADMPQVADDAVRKGYVDQQVSSVEASLSQEASARQAADTAEASARQAADAVLQANINAEKSRIDSILLASDADKDSFAEIVTLINSIDTTNDSAFASYVLSNNAALAKEVSDRLAGDTTEASARAAADTALQANINAKTLDSLANVNIVSKADGHVVEWDADSNKWINSAPLTTATVASIPVTTENIVSSQLTSTNTMQFQTTYGTTYHPAQDVVFSKIGFKLGRTSSYLDDYQIHGEIYEVDADFYANGQVLASNYTSRMTLVATSTDFVLGSGLAMQPAVPGMIYLNFNNIQLSASKYYVIWARAKLSGGSNLTIGSSTKYLWGTFNLGAGGPGSFQNHLKSVQGTYVTGTTESSAIYELYAMVTQSTTSAVTGLIKTNSSGLIDQSFLAYDIDFGSHQLKGVTAPTAATDAANKAYVDSQITAEASARQAADTALQTQINNILSNTDATALNSLAEIVSAFQQADNNLNQAITNISSSSSSALATETSARQAADTTLQVNINAEASARQASDTAEASARQAADAQLSGDLAAEVSARQAAALVFARFSGQLTQTDIDNGCVELAYKVKHESVSAFIDRLALRHGLDYTLSDVNGKTRILFASSFRSGAEAPAVGDLVHGNCAYANEDQSTSSTTSISLVGAPIVGGTSVTVSMSNPTGASVMAAVFLGSVNMGSVFLGTSASSQIAVETNPLVAGSYQLRLINIMTDETIATSSFTVSV